jgi:hypothetical protein
MGKLFRLKTWKAHLRKRGEGFFVENCGRQVPAVSTTARVRAVIKNKPIELKSVETYPESDSGESFGTVRATTREVAKALRPEELSKKAFNLYEKFRPAIPEGVTGWRAKGTLDSVRMQSLALGT